MMLASGERKMNITAGMCKKRIHFVLTFLGFAQGATVVQTGSETFSTMTGAEKPITPPAASSPPVLGTPSGRNIISNVYFPIEKLDKNLINTNGNPASSDGGGGSSSNSNNNNRRWSQGQKFSGLNDLRPDSDLINSPTDQHEQASTNWPTRTISAAERDATNVTVQLNNHAFLNCKVINHHNTLLIARIPGRFNALL